MISELPELASKDGPSASLKPSSPAPPPAELYPSSYAYPRSSPDTVKGVSGISGTSQVVQVDIAEIAGAQTEPVSRPDLPAAAEGPGLYRELKRMVVEGGLLEGRPRYYALKFAYTLGGLAILVWALLAIDWLPARVALLLACALAWAQVAFLGHDLGHRQVFTRASVNDAWGLVTGNLLLGMSVSWWRQKHNAHHANPNDAGMDPDLEIPILAFTAEDAQTRTGLVRRILPYQAALFVPFTSLAAIDFQAQSILYQLKGNAKTKGRRALELSLLFAHAGLYVGGILWAFGLWGLLIGAAHQACLGILLGSAFAPNHKGMPMMDDAMKDDFLRKQVLTARNVRGKRPWVRLVDWFYGGLNYQIEHHLFPSMPRCNLPQARALTRQFCRRNGISYHETGVLQSYHEIMVHLNTVGRSIKDAVQPGNRAKV